MLSALMTMAFMDFVIWVTVRSMNRNQAARDRAETIKARVREAHGIEEMFVSFEDSSFVGLSGDRERIVLGRGDEDRVLPMAAVTAVEGLRDETMLVRADHNSPGEMPPASRNPADLPERIRSLSLRIQLEDGDHTVLFSTVASTASRL